MDYRAWVGFAVALLAGCGPTVDPGDEGASGGGTEADSQTGSSGATSGDESSSASASATASSTTGATSAGETGADSGAESSSGGDPFVDPVLPVTIDSARLDVECIDSCGSVYGTDRLRLSVSAQTDLADVTIELVGWALPGEEFPAEPEIPFDSVTLSLEANTPVSVDLERQFENYCPSSTWDGPVDVQLRIDGILSQAEADSFYGGPGSNEC